MVGEGREGDWDCGGCGNRNYAFRSLCNRCRQPRLLVDVKTPRDSKWIPRIGDWICSGCSNNNYASRAVCKKCNLSREEAALSLPALSLPSMALLPTYAHYLARQQQTGFKVPTNGPHFTGWYGTNYGINSQTNMMSQYLGIMPKDWRNGDWICVCGFHNYSSRDQCKKCNLVNPAGASVPEASSTLGIKRLASDDFSNGWDNKRLNAGEMNQQFSTNGGESFMQANIPTLMGKGAKQWREGDWMCNGCNNHNYASRTHCNRCKTQREDVGNVGSVL
ncbi:hypothetical protein LUZ60_016100 [Juncus effusus]|nr:hypothetical protein LUZ60_016100 [Juncus effusus]